MEKDIEKRLKALEKRLQADDLRWQMLGADLKAFRLIIESMARPICALNPVLTPTIIKNLTAFENDAKFLNLHASTILGLRQMRKYFEALANKFDRVSSKRDAPRRAG